VLKPAGTHSVHALFVFLHLLKGEAERRGQLLLGQAKHHAPHAQPTADVLVDGIWSLCAHLTPEFSRALPATRWAIFERIVLKDKHHGRAVPALKDARPVEVSLLHVSAQRDQAGSREKAPTRVGD
jgi:hypothetical protein